MFYDRSDDLKRVIMRELVESCEVDFIDFFWQELYEHRDNLTVCDVACAFSGLVDDSEAETDDWRTFRLAPHLRSWFEDADEEYKDAAFADEYIGDLARTAWGDYEDEDEDDEDDE